jgi:predicted dienelactone hydrolase
MRRVAATPLRSLIAGLLSALVIASAVSADAQTYNAGITRVTVEDTPAFETLVAYPTEAGEVPFEDARFQLSAGRGAVADGVRFPVVLFSHGSGRGPGTPMVHAALLLHLARQGFIVIAPFHPGTGRPFVDRPRQIRLALEMVLADPRFSAHADSERVGMMAFSFGGAVALLSAGASLDLAHLSAYCGEHYDDPRACDGIPTDSSWADTPSKKSADALHLRALVLMEPYGAPFAARDLGPLTMPILIYVAQQSDLRAEGNTLGLAKALPPEPQVRFVPGRHFVFADPCTPALAADLPQVCQDPPSVDRADFHQHLRQEISDFFRAHL